MESTRRTVAILAATLILAASGILWFSGGYPSLRTEPPEPESHSDPEVVLISCGILPPDPVVREESAAVAVESPMEEAPDSGPPVQYALQMGAWSERTDDPIEAGDSSLMLRLRDSVTLKPVSSSILLWRNDAPGNTLWTRGDQCQREVSVGVEGVRIDGLAEGRYRAVVASEAKGGEWAQGFGVVGPLTDVTIDVRMPGRRGAWLVLYDEDGRRIEQAEIKDGRSGYSRSPPSAPDWAVLRKRKRELATGMIGVGAGGGSGGGAHRRFKSVSAGPRGFVLPGVRDASRARNRYDMIDVRVDGRSTVSVRVRGDDPRDHDYVGVVIRPERVLRSIVLPDGRTGVDVAEDLEVKSSAVHREDLKTNSPWREIRLTIRVRYSARERYEPFRETFTLSDGFAGLHSLVPVEASVAGTGGARD